MSKSPIDEWRDKVDETLFEVGAWIDSIPVGKTYDYREQLKAISQATYDLIMEALEIVPPGESQHSSYNDGKRDLAAELREYFKGMVG
jgi:hypothetical protein